MFSSVGADRGQPLYIYIFFLFKEGRWGESSHSQCYWGQYQHFYNVRASSASARTESAAHVEVLDGTGAQICSTAVLDACTRYRHIYILPVRSKSQLTEKIEFLLGEGCAVIYFWISSKLIFASCV